MNLRLASEGFDVRVAGDGPQALELAAGSRPDLVVLDLMLPGMDGLDVCRELQRTEWIPVLMLTARTDEAAEPKYVRTVHGVGYAFCEARDRAESVGER